MFFYVAPMFTKLIELQNYWSTKNILSHSKFIKTRGLPFISGKSQHSICFDNKKIKMFSKPTNIDKRFMFDWETFLNKLDEKTFTHAEFITDLFELIISSDIRI